MKSERLRFVDERNETRKKDTRIIRGNYFQVHIQGNM